MGVFELLLAVSGLLKVILAALFWVQLRLVGVKPCAWE